MGDTCKGAYVPWKSQTPMDLRVEMMERLAKNESLTALCREYGISRKTGEKFKARFKQRGLLGLANQSRAPIVIPHRTPPEVIALIVAERQAHPSWGPKKLKVLLEKRFERSFPAVSTMNDILGRHGLVRPRPRRMRGEYGPTTLREAPTPNVIWCVDYKGQFKLGDKSLCYPLTITDQHARFILACEGMAAISGDEARDVFEDVFRRYGLPEWMRSDNGSPFASKGLANLTKLSAYWMLLGIGLERIRPGCPQENGRHERMHRTLKFETARPGRTNLLQQQERFDDFVEEFNTLRPHEALEMKVPAAIYVPSTRPHPKTLEEFTYADYDDTLRVNGAGAVRIAGRGPMHLSDALVGHDVGVRELRDGRLLFAFGPLELGHLVAGTRITPINRAIQTPAS